MTVLAAVFASLTITLWPSGTDGPSTTWTLRCGPAGGTHPAKVAACRRLSQLRRPFAPVPKLMACTQIYGGPEVALVRGKYRGNRVWTYFRLNDGCEIDRWRRIVPLIPTPGAT